MNRPIFIVGSPRSGTSILTWCLGQHSNILVQEESDWLGRFALDVETAYRTGTQRGERSQLGSLGVQRPEFFQCFGNTINNLILQHRYERRRIAREEAMATPASDLRLPAFQTERSEADPKGRWVDGTPEYSFYICGLRKLFPDAVFVHLVRDVNSVVRSMLKFTTTGGPALVQNEEQAYDYWLRAARACLQAERAYGSGVVYRMMHADLVKDAERIFRSLLHFLQEPYEPACLEPLQHRINSSDVPPDFNPRNVESNQLVEACQLEAELMHNRAPIPASPAIAAEMEAEFEKRVHHNQNVDKYHLRALQKIAALEEQIDGLKCQHTAPLKSWRRWTYRKIASS
jgi:Sulfotransferase family